MLFRNMRQNLLRSFAERSSNSAFHRDVEYNMKSQPLAQIFSLFSNILLKMKSFEICLDESATITLCPYPTHILLK